MKMKKMVGMCLVALTTCAMLIGCGSSSTKTPDEAKSGKVVVNIEGTVSAVNGNEITLDSGKVVVITDDTVFAGDPDTNSQVSDKIDVGNFVQGYTSDDLSQDKVNASRIWSNEAMQRTGGKIVINFEGVVASVDEDSVTLDNGQVVRFSDSTIVTDVNGAVNDAVFAEGGFIQGFTENDPTDEEITAKRIHIVVY
ncbi:MAG: hypothetical protein IJ468_05705 [Lachnospiraceae bacterium]|nr:hypothetical protein [Lachnospiraceae bacterium]